MNSYEDELNDAIQKALQSSLRNLEKMPEASVDQKIYKALRNKSRKPRPLILLSAVGILVLFSFGIFKVAGHYIPFQNDSLRTSARKEAVQQPKLVHEAGTKHVANTQAKKISNTIPTIQKPLSISPPVENAARDSEAENPVAGVAGDDGNVAVHDQETHNLHVRPIPASNVMPIPVAMRRPEIGIAGIEPDSMSVEGTEAKTVWEKLDIPKIDPSKSKSYAWLFNVAATHTFQSIYLLPNEESRILKVSFPNSAGNLGYKVSAGVQAGGFQVVLHYSHLRWKAEYVYAVDEFKADEYATKKYVFERLGVAQTVTNRLDLVGVGVNKQLNFKSRHLGRTFARLGATYSRPLQASGQNFLSGNISAGKVLRVNAKADLTIGPYFEYHFIKVPTDQPSIQTRPNQLGISMGLRLNGSR